MLTHPLDEAYAKLARARRHLKELDHEVRRFADAHPYGLALDRKSEPGVILVRAKGTRPNDPVPLLVGVIAGDVLHNLRSALEYLAWQLAIIGKGPDKDTHFPVCDTQAKWQDFGRRYTARMRPNHAVFIERLQPYHRRHGVLLGCIAVLNNADKHSLINTVSWGMQFRPPTVTGPMREFEIVYQELGAPMYDGAPLFRITKLRLKQGGKVHVDMDVPYTVLFGKPFVAGEVAASLLDLMRAERYVRLILRVFRAEFE